MEQQETFHAGEIVVQQRVGEEAQAARNGRMMADAIVPGAIRFIENQSFLLVSSQNGEGQVWVSVISGEPTYCKVLDERTLEMDTRRIRSNPLDAFWINTQANASIGMLFIELATRRRFRVNGIVAFEPNKLVVSVQQAYPNCPKYIQRRQVTMGDQPTYSLGSQTGTELTQELIGWISAADTFFVGSSDKQGRMDASHRGGPPGFVRILDSRTLRIPDYPGNSMYNTLGNFMANPKAGLLFVDFEQHRTLQLTGSAQIIWQSEDATQETGGTGRWWLFKMDQWIVLENLQNMDWHFMEYSPFNPS